MTITNDRHDPYTTTYGNWSDDGDQMQWLFPEENMYFVPLPGMTRVNKFPIRWRYSQDEIDYNKANLEEALNRQYNGNDGFNEKMWIVPNAVETPIAGKIITDFGK